MATAEVRLDPVLEQIAFLLDRFQNHPHPEVREGVSLLIRDIYELHRLGFRRLVEAVTALGGKRLLDAARSDPAVHGLFEVYDLAPDTPPTGSTPPTQGLPGMDPRWDEEFHRLSRQIEHTLQGLEQSLSEEDQERLSAIIQAIDLFHRTGLHRLVNAIESNGEGHILGVIGHDPVVEKLFEIYDVRAKGRVEEAERALAPLHPLLASEGGDVKVVGVKNGVVKLRLVGECWNKGPTSVRLKREIQRALKERLPGFQGVEVEAVEGSAQEAPEGGGVGEGPAGERTWHRVCRVEELPPGGLLVAWVEGIYVLLVHLGGQVHAYRDACGSRSLRVSLGTLHGETLHCPWHGCLFDLRTGRELRDPEVHLERFPVNIQEGEVYVALP